MTTIDQMWVRLEHHQPYADPPEQQDEVQRLREQNKSLLEALEMAREHLEWIGWGDTYERECAKENGLEKIIDAAIAKTTGEQS